MLPRQPYGNILMRLLSLEDELTPDWKETTILMKTVEELVYYCHECEPVGALLLSGEWGCGKTHLIEHELKDALADTSVVLRISLFGMTLPEEIHVTVRREWMAEYCKIKGIDKVTERLVRVKNGFQKWIFFQNGYGESQKRSIISFWKYPFSAVSKFGTFSITKYPGRTRSTTLT